MELGISPIVTSSLIMQVQELKTATQLTNEIMDDAIILFSDWSFLNLK